MFKKLKNYLKGDVHSQSLEESNHERHLETVSSSVNTWPVYQKLQQMDLLTQFHGLINIESGNIGIYTQFFSECDTEIHVQDSSEQMCKCGRNEKNFISLRCGDGDGIYPVFALIDSMSDMILAQEGLPGLSVNEIGYLIRCNAGDADVSVEVVSSGYAHESVYPSDILINEKVKSNFYLFGKITNLKKIYISDAQAGINSPNAILNSNYPTLGEYFVFAICLTQPRDEHEILPNSSSEKLSDTIIVPRDIIVLHKNYAKNLLHLVEELPLDMRQIEKDWLNSAVQCHLQPIPELTYMTNFDIYARIYGRSDLGASWLTQAYLFEGEDYFDEPWSQIENMLAQTTEQLSNLYARRGLLDKAEEVSLELINSDSKMNEDIATTINSLVFSVYLPQKKYEKAKVLLERVVNEFSGLQAGIAYGNLGIIEFNSKQIPKAKECFSKSFDLVKGTWAEDEALYYLGLIAINQGNKEEGITLLEKCYEHVESGTNYPQLAKMKLDEIFSQK